MGSRDGQDRISLAPTGVRTLNLQPVASRYTNNAILASLPSTTKIHYMWNGTSTPPAPLTVYIFGEKNVTAVKINVWGFHSV